jgi:hypothetical protein
MPTVTDNDLKELKELKDLITAGFSRIDSDARCQAHWTD